MKLRIIEPSVLRFLRVATHNEYYLVESDSNLRCLDSFFICYNRKFDHIFIDFRHFDHIFIDFRHFQCFLNYKKSLMIQHYAYTIKLYPVAFYNEWKSN